MIRQAPRLLYRSSALLHRSPTRRFLSTAPPAYKSRSWKSSAARWGLAVGAIYYYNTSDLFAEEPAFSLPPPQNPTDETSLPTLESIAQERAAKASSLEPTNDSPSLEATEEEASQEGAFNEETGEINWDCPCLGGMAHGPCGEQFRAAFSCFVFSKEEPKGMDCIPNFKNMQECFREHPEEYGAELEDDDAPDNEPANTTAEPVVSTEATPVPTVQFSGSIETPPIGGDAPRKQVPKQHVEVSSRAVSESDELVPKAAHDATAANTEK